MQPSEEQLVQMITAVACETCGVGYAPQCVEVIGRRETVWFIRVRCLPCGSGGLIAARVQTSAILVPPTDLPTAPERLEPLTDRPNRGQVSRGDVRRMGKFLQTFNGDFQGHFAV